MTTNDHMPLFKKFILNECDPTEIKKLLALESLGDIPSVGEVLQIINKTPRIPQCTVRIKYLIKSFSWQKMINNSVRNGEVKFVF